MIRLLAMCLAVACDRVQAFLTISNGASLTGRGVLRLHVQEKPLGAENIVAAEPATDLQDTISEDNGAELTALLASLNLGHLGQESQDDRDSANAKSDLEERQMIALRRKLGEEDFRRIFDPRNPFIGEA
eukprot:TRINITY_DN9359_c0_g1_i1.p1 TRINITY_DN9359_c0_g1~~TRINITY_DN9359_c0_g1_i1.p1  ORF type:complete len:130 (-),score=26.34 TRINITY_DN9359_c0_g1_i1:167-556(-)